MKQIKIKTIIVLSKKLFFHILVVIMFLHVYELFIRLINMD